MMINIYLRDYYKKDNTQNITIGDGLGNEWNIKDFLTNPYLIITIISLIIISGAIIISIYDIELDTIKQFPLNIARMTWNYWTSIGTFLAHQRFYKIGVFGTIIDPVNILVWVHWSAFDHGIVRPSLFLTTIFATRLGRTIGIFT